MLSQENQIGHVLEHLHELRCRPLHGKIRLPSGQGRVRSSDAFLVFGGVFGKETARARPLLGPPETKLGGPMNGAGAGAGAGAHQLLI